MNEWYYVENDEQRGPVGADELAFLHSSGRIAAETLLWRDGWAAWRPLSDVWGETGIAAPAGAPPPSPPPPQFTPFAAQAREAGPAPVVFAGFWRRWAAVFIDGMILGAGFYAVALVALLLIGGVSGFEGWDGNEPPAWITATTALLLLAYYPLAGLYYSLQESGPHQATLGKRALGIKVCDLQGRRVGFGQAFGRWVAALLGYFTLYLGFLMAAFTERKQALHDMIAGTQVTDRWAYSEHPERQSTGLSGCLIAVLVAMLLMIVLALFGVLAAIAIPAYSDYNGRGKVSEAIQSASLAKLAVEEFIQQADRCPRGWEELGVEPPSDPALASAEVGELADGRCVIELRLGPVPAAKGVEGHGIWLTRQAEGVWECSSDMEGLERYLPGSCR